MTKYGICIATFGDSSRRLKPLFKTIERFTKGFEYEVYVRDDGTPTPEHVALSEATSLAAGATFLRGAEWGMMWKNFEELGRHACKQGCDVIVYINDDCLMSKGWLVPIDYFYAWNECLKPGMVSTTIVEAWELAMNGILPHELCFYSEDFDKWSCRGTLLRERIEFSQELFDDCKVAGRERIILSNYDPIGPILDGKYVLDRAVPLVGGLGPFFSIRTDVFQEVDGFKKCEYTGDYEALIGLKVWEAGYTCCSIPGPPAYHARGIASYQAYDIFLEDLWRPFRPWTSYALHRFKQDWGFEDIQEAIKRCEKEFMNPNVPKLERARVLHYQDQKFPINIEYDKLTEINLGAIDWRDAKQAARMKWVGDQCLGNVLDVGCANGGLLEFIGNCESYTGVDLDRVRIDEAQRERKGRFFVMDATYGFPFPCDEFDVSVCADMLEHVPKKQVEYVVGEMVRITKSKVILTFPSSKQFMENKDHIWDSTPDEVQRLLEPFEGICTIDSDLLEDFTLVTLEVNPCRTP